MEYFAEFWKDKYWHVGSKRYVEACKRQESSLVQVELTESENGEYYGWQDAGSERYEMIWPDASLFKMCFPYGPEVEEKRGRGRAVRLDIMAKEAQE